MGTGPVFLCSRLRRPSGGAVLGTERVVCRSFVPVGRQTTQISAGVELVGPATYMEGPLRPRDPSATHVEVIQSLVQNVGFSRAVVQVAAADLRRSTAALYRSSGPGSSVGAVDGMSIPSRCLSLR